MLAYYLTMEPQLFRTAVEDQLIKLRDEKDQKEQQQLAQAERQEAEQQRALAAGENSPNGELTLYKRMEEMRALEVRATLEDLMYVSILERFMHLRVDMMPHLDGFVDVPSVSLVALTEGLHSKEALELVKEHLLSVMGPATLSQFSNAMTKISKFQMAQVYASSIMFGYFLRRVYASSIMFGYFLRRVDRRFQLESSLGTLPMSKEDTVARLELLFSAAADQGADDVNPDWAPALDVTPPGAASPSSSGGSSSSGSSSGGNSSGSVGSTPSPTSSSTPASGPPQGSSRDLPATKPKSALRKYVESFDQAAMVETARIVSAEGSALVERQTSALLGDIKKLTIQIQDVVGKDATSMEDVLLRMQKAVEQDKVETLVMTVGTQRRAVLEAVAFGTFLRDVESHVHDEYGLLTPLPTPKLPPGASGGRAGGGGGAGGGGPRGNVAA
ncbi:MAG: hypothetical protein WDW38_004247 [Sanguina aurantia]